ncbi:hypothetical protein [Eggerthella guodeyinii]|uniref:Uncharacterized protein n=1 Tax=Eggerthella guodeyinii TaxID=2690837 RepID=A0A6N7RKF0_9ACTN|nr:hypothetical protein [Eggerthella guodeyinii]MRX81431.1 hypothetical protein [Eggerthella guodeyinii]
MNERDFRQAYEAMQHDVTASSDLKQRTLAAAKREPLRGAPTPQATVPASEKRPHRRTGSRGAQAGGIAVARRWGLPAAACLVAVAIVVGGVPVVMGAMDAGGHSAISMNDAQQASGFSVRAYAADGSSMLELGSDGTVVFGRRAPTTGLSDQYDVEGAFTGCTFRVEGDGIARVQMNVSKGVLYRSAIEQFRRGDEPEKWQELISTKPTNRGMGEYYGAYDEAYPLMIANDGAKDNPDAIVGAELNKLLGSTIDVSAQDDPGIATGETSFGLWTNEGNPTADAAFDPYAGVIDQFDGQTLTVTVTFEDGHSSTQVIELHAADFRVEYTSNTETELIPEIVDPAQLGEGEHSLRSLYGTVIEANKEAFPLPLDNANDRAGEVLPAYTLDRQDETRPTDTTLGEDALLGEGTMIETTYRSEVAGEASFVPLSYGYPTVERLSAPPDGKTLGDFNGVIYGWFGDTAYVNKCSNEVWGYGFNDDGTLTSDDFTYVTATFDVTNTGDEAIEVWPAWIGEFAIVNGDGVVATASTGYSLDFSTSDNALPCDEPQHVGIAAGDTVQITILRVLSNRLADDDSLLFVPANIAEDGTSAVTQAFSVGGQI